MARPSPIPRSNKSIMRNADRDQVTGFLTSGPFRSCNYASTSQLGSSVYPVLPRETQVQFQMATRLSPVFTLEEHSGTTYVSGDSLMPVTFTAGSISYWNLQLEPLGPRLLTCTYTAFCVQHGFC